MTEEQRQCREQILSEDYMDFILEYPVAQPQVFQEYGEACREVVNPLYAVTHLSRERAPFYNVADYGFRAIPSLFSLQETTSMEASGILRAQNRPVPDLRGQGVLVGIIDTGIDYTHPVFREAGGGSRIVRLWDQTDQTGEPPLGIPYGTEYRQEQLNEALRQPDPRSLVPTVDEVGHGTFLAGIAAGGEMPDGSFVGAAPEASLAVVKLKPAKENLKAYYFVETEQPVYQETDILLAVRYLLDLREQLAMPLVICLGLGTNRGGHDGYTPLEEVLSRPTDLGGLVPVAAAGNEGNRAHHYYGVLREEEEYQDVEVRIPPGESGFRVDFWAQAPELYSVGFLSPGGEEVPRIPPRVGSGGEIGFVLEETTITVDYRLVEVRSGSQLISMGFQLPTPGIWVIRIYNTYRIDGRFHLWLPVEGQVEPGTYFLEPSPDTTLTIPSTGNGVLAAGAYNHRTDSMYVNSGRGYTRLGTVKPDLAAPGVSVYGPAPGGQFTTYSGTSVAAAHVAGAAADLLHWGIVRGNEPRMDINAVRAYLILGARRKAVYSYPNREWGYGALDLYGVFEILKMS